LNPKKHDTKNCQQEQSRVVKFYDRQLHKHYD
jgi:hypothetical protein